MSGNSGISKTKSGSKSTTSTTTSAYDKNFAQILRDHFIDIDVDANPPDNLKFWSERVEQPRAELSNMNFTIDDHRKWVHELLRAKGEPQVMSMVFPMIIGAHKTNYPYDMDRICNNWAPLLDVNILSPKPDYYNGHSAGPENVGIRRALDKFIVPSTTDGAPFLANFFVEVKAGTGSLDIATRQACHDGALGARGMQKLQMLADSRKVEIFDKMAYTVSGVFLKGNLELYAHHITQPDGPGSQFHYHMTLLGQWGIRGSARSFRDGAAALRNAADVAFEFREQFIKAANQRLARASREGGTVADTPAEDAVPVQSAEGGPRNEINDSLIEERSVHAPPTSSSIQQHSHMTTAEIGVQG